MTGHGTRNVVVLGSTGSVGTQTLQVLRRLGERFRVLGLATNGRWELLVKQAREFRPQAVCVCREQAVGDRCELPPGTDLLVGSQGLQSLARLEGADVVLSAVSGAAGLPAALRVVECGRTLALANKESLVMGGGLLLKRAAESGATVVPVDSEHSALFQLLESMPGQRVRRLLITASGGPFRDWTLERMQSVSPRDALDHPTWQMGRKITIDSATLFNKALEVVEARWLFGIGPERIGVLIHPQSVVHGLIELEDGAVLAHMGVPDMRMPIQYALSYPTRLDSGWDGLDLACVGSLDFAEPDLRRFPALELGYQVARAGGTSGAVLNAANEVAVDAFLRGALGFTDIAHVVRWVLDAHDIRPEPDFEQIIAADRWAREEAKTCLHRFST